MQFLISLGKTLWCLWSCYICLHLWTWVSTSQSEEWPDRQLLVQGRVTQERLLLQLLKLLRAGEAQGVWPQVGPGVDEGMVQRLSCERVHKGGLWHGGDRVDQSRLTLGLADLRVGFSKLQADRLGQVGIEPHSLLEILLCRLGGGSAGKGHKSHGRGRLSVLAGHF